MAPMSPFVEHVFANARARTAGYASRRGNRLVSVRASPRLDHSADLAETNCTDAMSGRHNTATQSVANPNDAPATA